MYFELYMYDCSDFCAVNQYLNPKYDDYDELWIQINEI